MCHISDESTIIQQEKAATLSFVDREINTVCHGFANLQSVIVYTQYADV